MKDNEIMKLRNIKISSEFTHFVSSSWNELELHERYSPHHPSCHHIQNEHVEVEVMDMLEVDGMDMVEEQDHPTNHWMGRRV
jgi:hypothetical protein